MLEADADGLKPGCGWLPPSWLPQDAIRKALRSLSRAGAPALADYSAPLGLPPLRRLIARRMAERGIEAKIKSLLPAVAPKSGAPAPQAKKA